MLIISILLLCLAFFNLLTSATSAAPEINQLQGLIYALISTIFFVLHHTNKQIKNMQQDIDTLWEIAQKKGYKKPCDCKIEDSLHEDEYFTEEQAEEYFANLNDNKKDG